MFVLLFILKKSLQRAKLEMERQFMKNTAPLLTFVEKGESNGEFLHGLTVN